MHSFISQRFNYDKDELISARQGQHGRALRLAPRHGAAAERAPGLISPPAPHATNSCRKLRTSFVDVLGRKMPRLAHEP